MTTKKASSDISCVLNVGDHDFITHESVINYGDAKIAETDKIKQAIKKQIFKPKKPITNNLLNRIIKGAKSSNAFPQGYLKYISGNS